MKTERLQLRIDADTKEKIRIAAEKENRTISNYIEVLIKKELEKNRPSN